MKKWKYKILDSVDVSEGSFFKGKSRETVEAYLNDLGAEGWEIINIDFREIEGRTSFTGVAKKPQPVSKPRK